MRTVLVAGSSGGIGTAISKRLAQSRIALIGVDRDPPADPSPFSQLLIADVTAAQTPELARSAAEDHGGLWAVVYCVGEYPLVSFEDYSLELWDRVHDANARAAFSLTHALHDLIEPGGRIILVASGAAHIGSNDIGYSASKSSVLGLARALARSLARRQILVNAVCPGVIDTPMSARMSPERREMHVAQTALLRVGAADEVAVVIEFLLDPDNTYMTGAVIDVNGGLYMR